MNVALNLYPVLTKELFEKIGFEASFYDFEYTSEGKKFKLNAVPISDNASQNEYLQIRDEKCEWVADLHDLSFKRKYTINNPKFLFGSSGVAALGSELGLALLWTSKSSNQRGVKIIDGFKNKGNTVFDAELRASFPPGQLKGTINFQTILYLKTPGRATSDEKHLAYSSGTILGTLDEYTIIIDGNGSVFPIVEVSEPSQPLWWVNCNWVDPKSESFDEENVRICINSAHPSYQLLKLEGGLKESPMLVEIIASALQIIIFKVRESECWEDIVSGQDLETGSIGQAVHYFLSTFGWDSQSPERLAMSIRKDFDSRI